MSLSTQKTVHPVSKWLEFKSAKETFQYYDKSAKENVVMDLPIKFIVLDELVSITGYNDTHNSGIWSNEVHNIMNEPLSVKTFKGGIVIDGMYQDISEQFKKIGGKYTKLLYVMLIGEINELACIKITGASLRPWIDGNLDVGSNVIEVANVEAARKGAVRYTYPLFSIAKVPNLKELMIEALEMDVFLQSFFNGKTAAVQPKDEEMTMGCSFGHTFGTDFEDDKNNDDCCICKEENWKSCQAASTLPY